jgi:hypothetical protein
MQQQNYCPRCIEDWENEEGEPMQGTLEPSDCEECGVCKECVHMCDCSKAE